MLELFPSAKPVSLYIVCHGRLGVLINPQPLHHLSFTPTYNRKTHFQTCLGTPRMRSTHIPQTVSDENVKNTSLNPLMQKDTHEVSPEMSWTCHVGISILPASKHQWLRIQEGLAHIYLFIFTSPVSHLPRRDHWLLHSIVAVTPHWKEVWSKAAWPDLGKHFHWEWTYCLSKGYSHRVGAADHITPGEQHERAKSGHSHPHTCFSFQQGQMGDTNLNRTSFLSLEPGWG